MISSKRFSKIFVTVFLFLFCSSGFTQSTYDIRKVDFKNYTYKSRFYGGKVKLIHGKESGGGFEFVWGKYLPFDTLGNEVVVILLGNDNSGGNAGYVEELHIFSYVDGKVKEEYTDCQQCKEETQVNSQSVTRSFYIWKKDDPRCCPSYIGHQTIQFENGILQNKIRKVKNKG